jgi:hypothetical protein
MFLQLDSNGEYSTPPHSKLAYGTMVPLLEYYDELDRYFIAAHNYLDMIRCVSVPVLSIKGVWPWRELSQLRSDMLLCDANFPVLKRHLKIKFLTTPRGNIVCYLLLQKRLPSDSLANLCKSSEAFSFLPFNFFFRMLDDYLEGAAAGNISSLPVLHATRYALCS